jgi:hypothetical protein
MLSVVMLTVIQAEYCAKCFYTDCLYDEFCCAECGYAESCYAVCCGTTFIEQTQFQLGMLMHHWSGKEQL